MPRNVRNFWLELNVDGRSPVETGPKAKDGGFSLRILIRNEGCIDTGAFITGTYEPDTDELVIRVNGEEIKRVKRG